MFNQILITMRNLIFILLPLMAFASCSENSFESGTATPPNNQIWYKSTYGDVLLPNVEAEFGAKILSNTYENGKGVITFGDEVKYIGDYAFYECEGLKQIAFPNSVTEIKYRAFSGCSNLTSVTIPDSVTWIEDYAFPGCSSLTSITIPNSVKSIGGSAFSGCSSLTSVIIPNSVTSIRRYAFYGCSSLTSVTIPNSVTSIGGFAFYGCSSLTSVNCIPTTPPSVDDYYKDWDAFDDNAPNRKIYVPAGTRAEYIYAAGWREYADAIEEKAM